MAVLNFTGREDIDRKLVEVTCEKDVRPLKIYLETEPALKDNAKFVGCNVVIEAYLRTKAERRELGLLADLKSKVEVVFKEFDSPEDVQFRLKIVNPSDKKLTGCVSGLRERAKKQQTDSEANRVPLLPVNWAAETDNLSGRFWKLDMNGPTLLVAKGKFASLGDVNQPAFKALAFPSIMKEALTEAFITRFDNPPAWAENWERLAQILGAEERPTLPDGESSRQVIQGYFEDVREWIDSVAALFAADCKLSAISSEFKEV